MVLPTSESRLPKVGPINTTQFEHLLRLTYFLGLGGALQHIKICGKIVIGSLSVDKWVGKYFR